MIIGTSITCPKGADRTFLTPWLSSGTEDAVFSFELFYETAPDLLDVTIYHKNVEDPGSTPGSPSGTFIQLGSTTIYQASVTGLKDLVRFGVTIRDGGTENSVAFRFLSPTWLTTAKT